MRDGNLYTGFSTEDTPSSLEAAAFKSGIVIVQVNEIVKRGAAAHRYPRRLGRLYRQGGRAVSDGAAFTRDPAKIQDVHVLMGMLTIRGVYAKAPCPLFNHGIGYNGAAIELLLPTYGESLALKGQICRTGS